MNNINGNSRFIGFIDECGDHSMQTIDRDFPIFVLCLIIVERQDYACSIIPTIAKLKLKYWIHEGINLHSRDIRKANGPFAFLMNKAQKERFIEDINAVMKDVKCNIFIVCINKNKHITKYEHNAEDPYELALKMCMERVFYFLNQEKTFELPIIAEARGKNEDGNLEKAFYKLLTCGTDYISAQQFKSLKCPLVFKDKRTNIVGLQLADLIAYPCSRHILRPEQPNRAFDIIEPKIYNNGKVRGWKIFP
ncbi:MAG: DUF3800 domain-containing protein [Deltaproteobacteria bacterium]|nr:DUF3800 domain-containing protein [Deltaproteobacteria bacterium]